MLFELLAIPGGPEIFVVVLLILIPIAFVYIAYKLVQDFHAYNEGKQNP